jgi:hypothetical protein
MSRFNRLLALTEFETRLLDLNIIMIRRIENIPINVNGNITLCIVSIRADSLDRSLLAKWQIIFVSFVPPILMRSKQKGCAK